MENKHKAHKSAYRKQQVKTYITKLWYVPISIAYVIKGITLLLCLIFGWFAMNRMKNIVNNSNQKLMIQRENWKPIKKENKLDKKELKKQQKEMYNEDKGV